MRLLFLLLSLLTFTSASFTPFHPRRTLHFHNEIIDTLNTPSTWIHPSATHKYQYMDTHHRMHTLEAGQTTTTIENDNGEKHTYIVQFNSPYTITAKKRVESFLNITFGSYVPHDAFLCYIYAVQAQSLIQDTEMRSIVVSVLPYKASNKLHSCVKKPSIDQGTQLDLLLVSDYDQSQQLAMGGIWTHGLSTELPAHLNGSNFDWSLGSRNIMGIDLKSEAQVEAFATWMANMDEVVMVQRRVKFRTGNMWARGEAEKAIPVPNYETKQGLITFDHPELRGQGEVIGVADTGLDYNSCYFYDPNFPNGPPGVKTYVSQLTTPNILRAKPKDQQHRKIVQYINFVDGDDADGHGTHVAGTIAGNGWNFPIGSSLKNFDGLASEAKLAFFDIGSSLTGGLDVPKNMDQDLFTWAYAAGARIHSDSWGGIAGGYDLNAQMVDTFIYNNPDMLVLFAAGNDGIKGASSISSPSTAKNAMAIGSSMNSNEAWIAQFCTGGYLPQTKLCSVAKTYPVLFGDTSMSAFSSQGPTPDSVDVGRMKPEIVLPGEWVLSALNGQDANGSCSGAPADVLKRDAGTSMSTPAGAAMAAVIRQWLRSGYYPSGTPTIEDQFIPSAALMKAIMIASVKPLTGFYDGNDILFPGGRPPPLPKEAALVPLEPTPNYRQGYGRFELQNGIYFPTDQHRILILQDKTQKFYDPRVVADGDEKKMTFCVLGTLSNQLPPRVTLTWTDPPVIATVASVVVNNLDLTVTPLGGTRVFQGNDGLPGVTIPDAINNAESVTLPNTNTPTTYVATVRATSLGQGPQSFALVVSGRVKMGACDSIPVETFQWVSTPWGSCTQPCYSTTVGIQKRSVFCVSSLTGGVADNKCSGNPNLGAKPAETQACNTNPCYQIKYYWQPGSYGPCTQTCGGTKTRQVVCMGTTGFAGTPDQCSGTKPAITTTCAQDTCKNALSNINSQWSVSTCTCSATCGGGTCTRTVNCLQNGAIVDDSICINAGNGAKPIPLQQCNTQACGVAPSAAGAGSGETFSWLVSDWSSCSVACGGGLQTRSVRCRSSAGYLDEDRLCTTTKPTTSATCATDACPASVEPPTYNWIIGLWGPCNVQTLQQTRWVICSTTSGQLVDAATCESAVGTMPSTSQVCTPTSTSQNENLAAPTYQWFTGTWSDPTIWCGPGSGTMTRLPICLGSAGRVAPTQASCPTPMPTTTQSVARNATCSTRPVWFTGAWLSECTNTNTPCSGVQQRHVVCVGTDGRVLGDNSLCTDTPPASTRGCATCVRTTSDATQHHLTSTWFIFLSIFTYWITRQ